MLDRDTLGRLVREIWIAWASEQPNPKPSWLVPYDELSEPDKEADRRIGEGIARAVLPATRDKLGSVWVDTASLVIGEPCSIIPRRGQTPPIDWDRFIELWDEQGTRTVDDRATKAAKRVGVTIPPHVQIQRPPFITITNPNGVPGAIVYQTGCDGWYPIYVERDAKGEPVRLVIELGGKAKP